MGKITSKHSSTPPFLTLCLRQAVERAGLSLILSLLLILSSCGPTYPAEKVSESIVKLCKKEYRLEVKPKIIGSTLWVYLPLDYLVDSSLRLAPETAEKVEHLLLCIHRVVLSTNRRIDFYAVTASDTKSIGADFTLIGYVPDIRKVRLLDISREEYYQRLLRDLSLNPKALHDRAGRHIQAREISLAKFLAEQISQRLKMDIREIENVEWKFENRIFKFNLGLSTLAKDKNEIKKKAMEEVKRVLQEYEFKDYSGIQISL
jgi:hypothetical protein